MNSRELFLLPPTASQPPTPRPTKAPTPSPTKAPTPSPTKAPTPSPTKAPTSSPTKAPTKTPTKAPTKAPTMPAYESIPPKFEYDTENNDRLAGVTCEDSFDVNTAFLEKFGVTSISDPLLEDIEVSYDFEVYMKNDANRADTITQLENKIFLDLLSTSPLLDNADVGGGGDIAPTITTCNELYIHAFGMDALLTRVRRRAQLDNNPAARRTSDTDSEEEWKDFLGWKNYPADKLDEDGECDSDLSVDAATCYPVTGYMTVQVPVERELSPRAVQIQVIQHVKEQMMDKQYESESIAAMSFIGTKDVIDGGNGNAAGDEIVTERSIFDKVTEEVSVTGAFFITGLVAAFVGGVFLVHSKYRNRKGGSKEREFAKIQNDALDLGDSFNEDKKENGPAKTPRDLTASIYAHSSLDSVELIDVSEKNSMDPIKEDATSDDDGSKLNIGKMMDSFRRSDNLSYTSVITKDVELTREMSLVSNTTENFGNEEEGRLSLGNRK